MTLTDLTAIAGLVFGVTGAVLGVMSFMRDRIALDVILQWDMKVIAGYPEVPDRTVGVVRIRNTGRRPVFVSHVALATGGRVKLLLRDSLQGIKLLEGDGPLSFEFEQVGFEEYARNWWLLRAEVSDASGRIWRSPMSSGKPPSWAVGGHSI
jgi:hypothetical protein